MDLKQVSKALKLMWEIKKSGKVDNLPIPTLIGDTGIGKSSILAEIVTSAKLAGDKYLKFLFLAQMEVGDLIGMPDKRDGKTVWLAPDWFPEQGSEGFLVLDELGDSDSMTRKAIMPLLLTGELHSHKLPQNVLLVCAMNPIGGTFGGNGFTKQFQNRLMFWKVKPSVDEWLAFAERIGLPNYMKNMVAEQPTFFEDQNDSNLAWQTSSMYDGIPSRRAVTVATSILELMEKDDIEDFGSELLASIVGPTVAGSLLTYKARNINEVMRAEDLYEDTNTMLSRIDAWLQANDISKVAAYLRLIKAHLSTKQSIQELDVTALGHMIAILPEDMSGGMLMYIKKNIPWHFDLLVKLGENPSIFAKLEAVMQGGKDV